VLLLYVQTVRNLRAQQNNPDHATPRLWLWTQRALQVPHFTARRCTPLLNRVLTPDAPGPVVKQLLLPELLVLSPQSSTPTHVLQEMVFRTCRTTTSKSSPECVSAKRPYNLLRICTIVALAARS
jgi:hypothetical protein